MDLNKVTLIGRLTRDPELRTTPTGKSVCSFTVATSRQWTDTQGQKQKLSEFSNIVAWGKLAETASQYLRKASRLYVEGRLQTREWTATDGAKRNRTEIVLDHMIMLDSKGAGTSPTVTTEELAYETPQSGSPPDQEIKVEDIPF